MIPAMIPLDPTEPAVAGLRMLQLEPGLSRWRGHLIRVDPEASRLHVGRHVVPYYSVGPERFRSWLLPRCELKSPLALARALVTHYYGFESFTLPPPDETEELEPAGSG